MGKLRTVALCIALGSCLGCGAEGSGGERSLGTVVQTRIDSTGDVHTSLLDSTGQLLGGLHWSRDTRTLTWIAPGEKGSLISSQFAKVDPTSEELNQLTSRLWEAMQVPQSKGPIVLYENCYSCCYLISVNGHVYVVQKPNCRAT